MFLKKINNNLIFANNISWQFSWRTNGVNNLISSAGAIFVISLAIERYIKVFLIDSREDELSMLRTLLQDKEMKLNVSNQEILTMIEKSKRGGLTFVGARRYAKANNKHMGDAYDSKQESSYIAYVDANNLYGWAMVQPLPYKDINLKK